MQFEPLAPVPAVTLARQLRQIPLFRFASVDELFRISSISRQIRYEAGAGVQEKGARANYIQVLLEGTFELRNDDQAGEQLKPPSLLGFQEVLEGTSIQSSVAAQSESVALVMPAEDFRALLSANIELAQGLFRLLLDQQGGNSAPSSSGAPSQQSAALPPDALKTVDKVLFLQTIPVLQRASAEELYELAAIAREVSFQVDELLFSEGHPSSMMLLLSGEIRLEPPSDADADAGIHVGPGECLGASETLAGTDWSWRARGVVAGRVLRVERESLYELLTDRMDLLQGMFGTIFVESGKAPGLSRFG